MIHSFLSRLLLLAATALSAPLTAHAASFDTGMVPDDHILLPDGPLKATVVLVSDMSGWSSAAPTADALLKQGAAVIGIDLPEYLKVLNAQTDDCVYMISDLESLAQQVGRARKSTSYDSAIIAGVGAGATMVLDMVAQSPDATLEAAVAVDPQLGLPLKVGLCTPAEFTDADGLRSYDLMTDPLPLPVTVLQTPAAPVDGAQHTAAMVAAHPDITVAARDGGPWDVLQAKLSDLIAAGGDAGDPLGLPLAVMPAKPAYDTMAVIYSGDGGWRDIDKEVGGVLQADGVPVVGLDSLRYFWTRRSPEETAHDLSRIIDTYRSHWHVRNVVLIGYSFGADVLPAAFNALSPQEKAQVSQISLLGLSHQTQYQIKVTGWLGLRSRSADGDPTHELKSIDPARVQCIQGEDEDDSGCPAAGKLGDEHVVLPGGHHFGGDYETVAARILDGLKRRGTATD